MNLILYKKLTLFASDKFFFLSSINTLNICTFFILEYILYPNAITLAIIKIKLFSRNPDIVKNTDKYNS